MFSHRSVFGEYSRTCWFRHVLCLKDHLVAGFQKLDNSIVHQRGEIDAFRNQKDKDRKQFTYRITVNLDEITDGEIKVRVSAQGDVEQDGNILQTGGIHEFEFFQRFFASLDKSFFLQE